MAALLTLVYQRRMKEAERQCDQMIRTKIAQFLEKIAQNVVQLPLNINSMPLNNRDCLPGSQCYQTLPKGFE